MRRTGGRLGAAIAAVALVEVWLGVYLVQVRLDRGFDADRPAQLLYVRDGAVLRRLVLGFQTFMADVYWLRTVQYYGREHTGHGHQHGPGGGAGQGLDPARSHVLLAPLLNLVVDLDPRMRIAYRYGAAFLSHAYHDREIGPAQAIALIDKGIRANPGDWELYFDKGFVYYFHRRDYRRAAEVFQAASRVPGAPDWLVSLAGRAYAQAGSRDLARQLWQALYDGAENREMRQAAHLQLQQLQALDAVDRLQAEVERFQAATGRLPGSWQELIAAGTLSAVPRDPLGVPYVLDPGRRRVRISERSTLSSMPEP